MTESEATVVLAALAAAWPRDWSFVDPMTKDIYRKRIVAMPRRRAAEAAVNLLIDSEERLPSVAKIRDAYRRYHDQFAPPALPEPDLTDDDVARNRRRIRALAAHVQKHDGHAGDLDVCPHPDCGYLRDLSVPGAGQD